MQPGVGVPQGTQGRRASAPPVRRSPVPPTPRESSPVTQPPHHMRAPSRAGTHLIRCVWLCRPVADKPPLLLEVLGHVGAGSRGRGCATEQGGPLMGTDMPHKGKGEPRWSPRPRPQSLGCFPRAGPRGPKGKVQSYELGLRAGPGPLGHPPASCVTLGQFQNPSGPRFPRLKGGVKQQYQPQRITEVMLPSTHQTTSVDHIVPPIG